MRLVDADALQMQIDEYAEHIRRLKKGKIPKAELAVLLDCKGCVDNAPTVDAVPVVRCMNCKHYEDNECTNTFWGMCERDFCSEGEEHDTAS